MTDFQRTDGHATELTSGTRHDARHAASNDPSDAEQHQRSAGLERLPRDRYEVASEIGHPDAILVRSADMHTMEMPDQRAGRGRAGAGTNNIPVAKLSRARHPGVQRAGRQRQRGEGTGARRHVPGRAQHLPGLGLRPRRSQGDDHAIDEAVEKGKKNFVGLRTAGPHAGRGRPRRHRRRGGQLRRWRCGMKVLGYDPQITVQRAWQLSSGVRAGAVSLDDLFARCDIVTVHVPLNDATRGLVNEARIQLMRQRQCGAQFRARADRRRGGRARRARQRPAARLRLRLPDATRSRITRRSWRCRTSAPRPARPRRTARSWSADTLRDFLENGNMRNSVNFPEAVLPRVPATTASPSPTSNVPNMVGQISTCLAEREAQHRRPAEQVARRHRLHADRHRRARSTGRSAGHGCAPSTACWRARLL